MFEKILFWCEFPERIKWEKLNSFFKLNNYMANIGIVCTSKKDYMIKAKKIQKLSNINLERAWPVLSKMEGYWFSSQTSRKSIDSLNQYKGMKIKLDIEPPLPKINSYKRNKFVMNSWLASQILKKGKNQKYLWKKIKELNKTGDVMLSTFSFPKFIAKRMGLLYDKKLSYNYIYYSSFIPKFLRWLYNIYMASFIKQKVKLDNEIYFAVGLLTPGIFNDEPCYQYAYELEKDMKFLLKRKVKNCVVFRLGSFLELKNATKWLKIIQRYSKH